MKRLCLYSIVFLLLCTALTGCKGSTEPESQIPDGTYAIEVSSSSSMFRIVDAQLKVEAGAMSAVLTLSGTGYEKLFMGTGEEALSASEDDFIHFVEDDQGAYTYEVPVEALDTETDVAAFSIRKQTWYDRVLIFQTPDELSDTAE